MKRTWISGVAIGAALTMVGPAYGQGGLGQSAGGGAATAGEGGADVGGGGSVGSGGPALPEGASGPGATSFSGVLRAAPGPGGEGGGASDGMVLIGSGDFNAIINPGPPGSLEEALERALKDNAEIAVARANRQQAEAAERLAISKVSQKVVEAYQQWQFDREALDRATASHESAAISDSEFATAKRAESASETALRFLYGGQTIRWSETKAGTGAPASASSRSGGGPMGMQFGGSSGPAGSGGGAMTGSTGNISGARGAMQGGFGGMPAGGGGAAPDAKSKVQENLAKKCDGVDFTEMPLSDIAQFLTETIGSPVIVDRSALQGNLPEGFSVTIALHNDDLTWQDVLTAISDTHDVGFLVRDYGILITTPQKAGSAPGGGFGGGFGGGGF